MEFNYLFQPDHLYRLLQGLWITAKIAFISVFFSAIFGTVFGVVMTSKNLFIKSLCRLYLETIRIIPILVLLFVFYFGFATWFNWQFSAVVVCIVVFCAVGHGGDGGFGSSCDYVYRSASARFSVCTGVKPESNVILCGFSAKPKTGYAWGN